MHRDENDEDGFLADVNPLILQQSADAAAWREQRRAAIRNRILSHDGSTTAGASTSSGAATGTDANREAALAFLSRRRVRGEDAAAIAGYDQQQPAVQQSFVAQQQNEPQPSAGPASGGMNADLMAKIREAAAIARARNQ
jgi:hypothetical protein